MKTILVIEDEAPIRDNLRRFLSLEGYRAIVTSNGEAGLAAARTERPDLILCDVMMPQMNGFEVLAALQQDSVLRTVPLVFLSASAEQERVAAAVAAGARSYVTKPFNLRELKDLLDECLGAADGAP